MIPGPQPPLLSNQWTSSLRKWLVPPVSFDDSYGKLTCIQKAELQQAVEQIRKMGGTVIEDVPLSPFWDYTNFMETRGIDADSYWSECTGIVPRGYQPFY
jgi:hypothetical protein